MEIATHPGKPNFKDYNGWLQKWNVQYNIDQDVVRGESGEDRTTQWSHAKSDCLSSCMKRPLYFAVDG